MTNPFLILQRKMRDSRHGHLASDALLLLAPYWAAEWSDTGGTPKGDILKKLDSYKGSKLVREMRSTVQSLPL